MTERRVTISLTFATDVPTRDALNSVLRAVNGFDPAKSSLEAASACESLSGEGGTVVAVHGAGGHRDGFYLSPEIDIDFSDADNPFLRVWLAPNSHYEYRLQTVALGDAADEVAADA